MAVVNPLRRVGIFSFHQPQGEEVLGLVLLAGLVHLVLMFVAFGYWARPALKDMGRLVVQVLVAFFAAGIISLALLFGFHSATESVVNNYGFNILSAPFYFYQWTRDWSGVDAEMSLILPIMGQVLAVGVPEEFVKLLVATKVLFIYFDKQTALPQEERQHRWRWIVLVGLAAGIGMGLAESILYHDQSYNRPAGFWEEYDQDFIEEHGSWGGEIIIEGFGWPIYFIRFMFCAGGHGVYTAAATLAFFRRREHEQFESFFRKLIGPGLIAIAPGALIHGLGNAILDTKYGWWAGPLLDVLAFGWLFTEIWRATGGPFGTVAARARRRKEVAT